MSADVFSHPWLGALFGDAEIAALLSAEATLSHMLATEAAYARALGAVGLVPSDLAEAAAQQITQFVPDGADLARGMAQDGVVVPALIAQLRAALPEPLQGALHRGMTSQDVMDTSLMLSLVPVLELMGQRITTLQATLADLDRQHGRNTMTGRTRMQLALPITVGDRLATWTAPLAPLAQRLSDLADTLPRLQLGGPVGNRDSFQGKADDIATHMAANLGLKAPDAAWHSTRSALADWGHWLATLSGHLGKIGQDITLMAQQGIDEVQLSAGGGSSAMPHKQNPVQAETLVTLGRYNAVQISGLHHALLHEQERSGAAWALEWMILPGMMMASGRALTLAQDLCTSIQHIGARAP
ncbi:3-carboxy-cis,cis-muconate cycloisomerase [Cognatishimia sp. SS12]|uniref:3-carboxy-cis,cis-muconate cycloisomerase n=1 Tax=Cognatishimia sp. SS12 TaxID=2979465 RepID=UPI00232A7A6F|nr:3-carboxy-cis,cis-muconate cycloisomerase [Cognatishimia sp. SS12]MDC0739320.1 3-carboxy-cis,cis-muconate cycloisomerase [Cognatishimia sp. SS12]